MATTAFTIRDLNPKDSAHAGRTHKNPHYRQIIEGFASYTSVNLYKQIVDIHVVISKKEVLSNG